MAVVVKSGTLTLYDSADQSCTPQRYSAGQGFVEHRNHVHLARNEGNKRVVVLVTYLGLKHGVNPDVPAEQPRELSVLAPSRTARPSPPALGRAPATIAGAREPLSRSRCSPRRHPTSNASRDPAAASGMLAAAGKYGTIAPAT